MVCMIPRMGGVGTMNVEMRHALERILQSDRHSVDRLVHADTSVAFCVEGGERVTLLLDRYPCEVAGDGEPAEVEIVLDSDQAERFCDGRLSLTGAVVTGAVETSGPVRKYLEVDAIVRRLLAGSNEDVEMIREARRAVRGDQMVADLDPALLA